MEKVRLKYISTILMGQSPPSSDYTNENEGIPFLQGTAEFGILNPQPKIFCLNPNKVCKPGDILFSVRAPVGELNISNDVYGIGRGLCAIRANEHSFTEFLWWALHHEREQLKYVETGTTYPAVSAEDVGNILIRNIPKNLQISINAFLEKATVEIDKLIASKQKLITLLTEKRQSLITQAVTKGVDGDIKLKDSGIEWLGKIPEHWIVERTKWLFKERNKRSQTGEEELLTVSHITGVTPRSEKDVNMFEAETTEGYKIVHKNDLVINTLWAWMGAMGVSPVDGIASPAYHVYEPLEMIFPDYLDAIVRMPIFAQEVTKYSKGVWSSRLRLYPEGFYEVSLPVPPLKEQEEILEYIEKEDLKIQKMSKILSQSIELLKERRSSLIAAAVSNQLDLG